MKVKVKAQAKAQVKRKAQVNAKSKEYTWFKSYDPDVARTLKPYPKIGPVDLKTEAAKLNPGATMLICQDRQISWKEMDRASDELAAALVSGGRERVMLGTPFGSAMVERGTGRGSRRLKKGDRVAVLFLNSTESYIAFSAIWKAGGIVVPLNPFNTSHELERSLNEAGAEIAIVHSSWYPVLKSLQSKTRLRKIIATETDEYGVPESPSLSHSAQIKTDNQWWEDLIHQYPTPYQALW